MAADTIRRTYEETPDGPRTRRPIGHKVEPDGPEPATPLRTYLFREDATADAKALDGWVTWVQYVGAWTRWAVAAKRKSWRSGEVWLMKDGTLARYPAEPR